MSKFKNYLYTARWALSKAIETGDHKLLDYAADEIVKAKALAIEEDNAPELISPDDEVSSTIGIIVGHTKRAPGAAYALGGSEYQYNKRVAEACFKYAAETYGSVVVEIIYRDGVGISGAYRKAEQLKCDAVIELHFNAFNKKVTGSETLCTTSSDDKKFAAAIQSAICKVFGRKGNSRGVKVLGRRDRGGRNIYSFPQGPNCLVEPFFGDVKSEAETAEKNISAYAKALVETTLDYLG